MIKRLQKYDCNMTTRYFKTLNFISETSKHQKRCPIQSDCSLGSTSVTLTRTTYNYAFPLSLNLSKAFMGIRHHAGGTGHGGTDEEAGAAKAPSPQSTKRTKFIV